MRYHRKLDGLDDQHRDTFMPIESTMTDHRPAIAFST